MFLFHSLHHGSFRRLPARNVFAFAALSFLFTALLFTSCGDGGGTTSSTTDNQLDENLVGTWLSTTAYGTDGYIITSTRLSYGNVIDSDFVVSYAGTIKTVTTAGNAGVIIFEYDADKKPTYYDSFDNYGDPDHIIPLKGNFVGVYYKNLKPGVSVQMGTAYVDGGAEEPTLDAAKKVFTLDKEGDYITYYGTYLK